MAAPAPVRVMPKHLKATYLADGEFLLEETRGTKLYYFPGPVLWILIFGLLTLASAHVAYPSVPGWGSITQYVSLNQWTHSPTTSMYVTIAFAILLFVGVLWLFARYLRWIATVYAVSSRRVIVQKGILGRDFDEIPVTQVRGVDVHQSLLQRMLGYGTVRVSSEGGSRVGNEDWKGIPQPFRFQKHIENATQNLTPGAYPPAYPPAAPPAPPR
jgi:membrane protein YdbS with pleckstrin-like domain